MNRQEPVHGTLYAIHQKFLFGLKLRVLGSQWGILTRDIIADFQSISKNGTKLTHIISGSGMENRLMGCKDGPEKTI